MWSWTGWIALALAVWLVVGVLVGLLIGRAIRHRDRQVPHDEQAGIEQGDDTVLSCPHWGRPRWGTSSRSSAQVTAANTASVTGGPRPTPAPSPPPTAPICARVATHSRASRYRLARESLRIDARVATD